MHKKKTRKIIKQKNENNIYNVIVISWINYHHCLIMFNRAQEGLITWSFNSNPSHPSSLSLAPSQKIL